MQTTESIENINKQLLEHFGLDTISGQPIFRVVWSESQTEKRLTSYTDSGVALLRPEVRELPKYRQWVQNKYVLERLCIIPDINKDELPTSKLSYEPIWIYEDKRGNPIPPIWWATKFLVDTLYAALGKSSIAKYKDEEEKYPEEVKKKRIKEMEEQLFGDESGLNCKTMTGEAVGYTGPTPNEHLANFRRNEDKK